MSPNSIINFLNIISMTLVSTYGVQYGEYQGELEKGCFHYEDCNLVVETIQQIELNEYTLSYPLTTSSAYNISTDFNRLSEGIVRIAGKPGEEVIITMEREVTLTSQIYDDLVIPVEVFWYSGDHVSVSEARRLANPVPNIEEFIVHLGERKQLTDNLLYNNGVSVEQDIHADKAGFRRELADLNDSQQFEAYGSYAGSRNRVNNSEDEFYYGGSPQKASASVYLFVKPLIEHVEAANPGEYEGEITLHVDYVSKY